MNDQNDYFKYMINTHTSLKHVFEYFFQYLKKTNYIKSSTQN